jgi:hypothetical protein
MRPQAATNALGLKLLLMHAEAGTFEFLTLTYANRRPKALVLD